jgi:serine/threonine protein kinase
VSGAEIRMSDPLRTLGRYTLKRRLAAGGMGEVYLGEVQGAANFTKQVAIKRILPHLAANEAFVAKFIDEANLMVQLHHGNIVPVLELADEGGELFIVMEYLPGRDLKAVLQRLKSQRKQFPVDLALFGSPPRSATPWITPIAAPARTVTRCTSSTGT